jgi:hypothetical protein
LFHEQAAPSAKDSQILRISSVGKTEVVENSLTYKAMPRKSYYSRIAGNRPIQVQPCRNQGRISRQAFQGDDNNTAILRDQENKEAQ